MDCELLRSRRGVGFASVMMGAYGIATAIAGLILVHVGLGRCTMPQAKLEIEGQLLTHVGNSQCVLRSKKTDLKIPTAKKKGERIVSSCGAEVESATPA